MTLSLGGSARFGGGLEAKALAGGDPPAEVFVSPRVIDRTAFEEYAARLRGLIDEASAEAGRLREAAHAGVERRDELRGATARTAEQAQRAVELVRALGERIAGLEAMLARAARLAETLPANERLVEEMGRSRLEEIERRVEARVREALERTESAAAALDERVDAADQRRAALAEAEKRGVEAGARIDAAVERARGLEEALEQGRRAAGMIEALEAARTKAEGSVDRLLRSLDGAIAFTDRLVEQQAANVPMKKPRKNAERTTR